MWGLINIEKSSKVFNRETKFKHVHCLILTQIGFYNALLNELPNSDLDGLHMIQNVDVRIIVNMPKYTTGRITLKEIEPISYLLKIEKN